MVKKAANPAILQPLFNFPLRFKYIFLALTGFVFYADSILNRYAYDDAMAIEKNEYVQKGFSGIPSILTHDSYANYYAYIGESQSGKLSGGRFRPLSEIIFATEQQLLDGSGILPYFRHLVNVLAYIASIIAIFSFLQNFLLKKIPGGGDIAFMATFLFAIHPLHTEVVANIKSLDEILSLLFIIITFIYSLTYLRTHKTKHLVIGTGSFLLALFSKEYAISLVFFIPLLFYLLSNKKPMLAIRASIPYYAVFIIYLVLRYNAIGFHSHIPSSDLLVNPYYNATGNQKIATEWFVLGKYLRLLVFPYPLSSDYSYNQIPYHTFSDITVIFSILVYASIFSWGMLLAAKKSVLSFAVFFFLFNILIISNFLFDIGATMGERLVYHSSLGFVIMFSSYFLSIISRLSIQTKRNAITGALSIIGLLCFVETSIRNTQWKDTSSLFIHDARIVPNSFVVNLNAGVAYMKLSKKKENTIDRANAFLDSAHKYLLMAVTINNRDNNSYLNLGDVCFSQGMLDSAGYYWEHVEKNNPAYPDIKPNFILLSQAYLAKGLDLGQKGDPKECITYMKKALTQDSANADAWYNMGIAYNSLQQYDSARYAWMKTLQYRSNDTDAMKHLQALSQIKNTR